MAKVLCLLELVDSYPSEAFHCNQCGEHLYGKDSVDLVQDIILELDAKVGQSEDIVMAS